MRRVLQAVAEDRKDVPPGISRKKCPLGFGCVRIDAGDLQTDQDGKLTAILRGFEFCSAAVERRADDFASFIGNRRQTKAVENVIMRAQRAAESFWRVIYKNWDGVLTRRQKGLLCENAMSSTQKRFEDRSDAAGVGNVPYGGVLKGVIALFAGQTKAARGGIMRVQAGCRRL